MEKGKMPARVVESSCMKNIGTCHIHADLPHLLILDIQLIMTATYKSQVLFGDALV